MVFYTTKVVNKYFVDEEGNGDCIQKPSSRTKTRVL